MPARLRPVRLHPSGRAASSARLAPRLGRLGRGTGRGTGCGATCSVAPAARPAACSAPRRGPKRHHSDGCPRRGPSGRGPHLPTRKRQTRHRGAQGPEGGRRHVGRRGAEPQPDSDGVWTQFGRGIRIGRGAFVIRKARDGFKRRSPESAITERM